MAISNSYWHRALERRSAIFAGLATVAILIGGLAEIVPMYLVSWQGSEAAEMPPYTPLELAGRDIYLREGCYNCHSQMIRPMYAETLRYGEWTRSWELVHDRPFQLGSRRIGPDLAREGGVRTDAWHYDHFRDPRSMQPGSIMPSYRWLLTQEVDVADIQASLRAMQTLGVPYSDETIEQAGALMEQQAQAVVQNLAAVGITEARWNDEVHAQVAWNQEVIALIAYLQVLGTRYDQIAGISDGSAAGAAEGSAAAGTTDANAEGSAAAPTAE
jgi:cytochrome c oxidase cbb3-type subunit I/II